MGLGIKRSCIGDIVLEENEGYPFAERQMASHIADSLTSAGRIRLQVEALDHFPRLEPPKGVEMHDTVHSMRLDAVVAAGFNLSRGDAADLIAAGHVKLRHLPNEHTDARVGEGDVISVRGHGRLVVEEVGSPTKKGRLPLRLTRYGTNRKR
jgi:RNA-binding protein YlmH